ncbi:glycerol dehydrogenase [Clostridium pasteurianum DSM 525 = ATCC 6013]|uniref:Glycerol dehydrogenase n=1 Tax=Clostridium pasteurianum DSM 525 = ATCC 6013 TaxID=1262449 RepID=A0A0H3J889_CLOPA|nr:iron-containing alcohol dehydrogenase family protein [Clostridium pasteurianum]AJA49427.1 glycerol dehydrogenase [Clostridium pasteurianum DSM 525 = ATCC 6013]AJA53415.1 glycerol dehydrogenase [Clostridium pasteurianum DSM 525 = ATCC 6013]AOZ76595.1 glycerol dehydrogenase [Clostridium pasteurianum DSM 525 = ATCC 6013]AOZ80392.1 glycerol dehydrogenase [Clostridium pasteurianum]ELP58457.1 glycerol dehydrogenase [Clostridium pasteurianum DSM 525 = ATCC 6013]
MIKIKAPEVYINEENILQHAGEYIAKLGNYTLVIGGKTALKIAGPGVFESLNSEKIKYEIEEFSGYCTFANIDKYAELSNRLGVNIIIGIGGGKVLDLVKAIGEKTNLPVVTIPTIAATCAAWSALSVIYNDKGEHIDYLLLEKSPKLILADTNIISEAPARYLNAGIGDTIVKWYEAAPHLSDNSDISLRIGLQTAKLALNILEKYADELHVQHKESYVKSQYKDVVDSIIILAGLVGSINGGKHRAAIGHAIHNGLTYIPDTKGTLHGEKVIFGLIVQFVLEGKSEEEIARLINLLNKLELPVTLGQLGIKDNIHDKIQIIADSVNFDSSELENLNFQVNKDLIIKAITKVDELGSSSLKLKAIV